MQNSGVLAQLGMGDGGAEPDILRRQWQDSGVIPRVVSRYNVGDVRNVLQNGFGN